MNHTVAVGLLMDWIEERCGKDGLTAVGHRVVQGDRTITSRSELLLKCVELRGFCLSILSIYQKKFC